MSSITTIRDTLKKAGLVISGISPDGELVEIVELKDHPWFLGCQFHPEFKSTPRKPHPLFTAFINAALKKKEQGEADRDAYRTIMVRNIIAIGGQQPFVLIAGPCVIESEGATLEAAARLKQITDRPRHPVHFQILL